MAGWVQTGGGHQASKQQAAGRIGSAGPGWIFAVAALAGAAGYSLQVGAVVKETSGLYDSGFVVYGVAGLIAAIGGFAAAGAAARLRPSGVTGVYIAGGIALLIATAGGSVQGLAGSHSWSANVANVAALATAVGFGATGVLLFVLATFAVPDRNAGVSAVRSFGPSLVIAGIGLLVLGGFSLYFTTWIANHGTPGTFKEMYAASAAGYGLVAVALIVAAGKGRAVGRCVLASLGAVGICVGHMVYPYAESKHTLELSLVLSVAGFAAITVALALAAAITPAKVRLVPHASPTGVPGASPGPTTAAMPVMAGPYTGSVAAPVEGFFGPASQPTVPTPAMPDPVEPPPAPPLFAPAPPARELPSHTVPVPDVSGGPAPRLDEPTPVNQPISRFCGSCGIPNTAGKALCTNCGGRLQ